VPSFTKKEPKDGTITESSKKSSRKEIKYYYSIPKSSYSVKENFKANEKDRIRRQHVITWHDRNSRR
jgi:hypothetical protein